MECDTLYRLFFRGVDSKDVAQSNRGQSPKTGEASSYRLISLLCTSYRLLERVLLKKIYPIVDPTLLQNYTDSDKGNYRPSISPS